MKVGCEMDTKDLEKVVRSISKRKGPVWYREGVRDGEKEVMQIIEDAADEQELVSALRSKIAFWRERYWNVKEFVMPYYDGKMDVAKKAIEYLENRGR